MGPKDHTGLAWHGRPTPTRSGGFVDGVGLNERTHQLAVDPEGVVPETLPGPREGAGGPNLDVERLDGGGQGPIQPNGRVRLP